MTENQRDRSTYTWREVNRFVSVAMGLGLLIGLVAGVIMGAGL